MNTRSTLLLGLLLIAGLCTTLQAQVVLGPAGPFVRRDLNPRNPTLFTVQITDPNIVAENYNFQLYTRYGTQTKVLQQQNGTDRQFAINLLEVPINPDLQLFAVVTVRHRNSGTRYTLTRTLPIRFTDPYQLCEIDWLTFRQSYSFEKLTVGRTANQLYALDLQPPKTRRVTLSLINAVGDTVATNTGIGSPYLDTLVLLGYGTLNHQGALRLRAHVMFDDGPNDGYLTEVQIPDNVPVPQVSASAGFGPFRHAVNIINTFVIQNLGPACTNVEWEIRYTSASGRQRTPVKITRPYDAQADSMHFVYNMRDVSPGSELVVRAHYGDHLPIRESRYPIQILLTPPVFSSSSPFPLQLGTKRRDTVTIDSLPPRVQRLHLELTNSSGVPLETNTIRTEGTTYISSGSLSFDTAPLKAGTYFVRAYCTNDQRDSDPDDFFAFDVRDTTTYFLTALTWGPFTQGDTSVLTPAVTNVRPYTGGDGWTDITGHFVLVDTMQSDVVLYESPAIDLAGVTSRDSIIFWPDTSYQFGKPIRGRVEIPTVNLPLSSQVRFERRINRSGRITSDGLVDHSVIMVPPPGELSTQPHLDTTFIVTRKQPLSLVLKDIIPEATAVRFALLGTHDPEYVLETVMGRPSTRDSAQWTTDVGVLPVNAKVVVTALTPVAQDLGAAIVRAVRTIPDTLSMTAWVPFDTLRLDWDLDPSTQLIRGVKPFVDTLTFHRLPAQTRQILLLSKDDREEIIDSVLVNVPYKLRYDSTLSVSTPFPFRSFATTELDIRYLSDGGPDGGIQYRRSITSLQQPYTITIRTLDVTTTPPTVVNRPLRQGSTDAAEITLKWMMGKGLASTVLVDSIVMDILDCAGTIIDRQFLPTPAQNSSTGVVTETVYSVSQLPLSTAALRLTVYSESMTLPRQGVATTVPFKLLTSPQLTIPLGLTYPSYRVSDTTLMELRQQMYATNINGVYEIDSLQVVGRNGRVALTLSAARPEGDTIRFDSVDFNQFPPDNSPYTIQGLVRTATCTQQPAVLENLASFTVPAVLVGPPDRNWVYSSQGWGPFQQGRAPKTNIIVSIEPSWYLTSPGELGDSLAVSIVGWSRDVGVFTPDTRQGFAYPAGQSLPPVQLIRHTIDLNPFDTVSAIGVGIQRFRRGFSGITKVFDELYTFPVVMQPFPDQLIIADSTGYEQSVLAGTSDANVMKSVYKFLMTPRSVTIDSLTFLMVSSDRARLDSLAVGVQSRNLADTTSVVTMQRNVSPYPWPHIARDRNRVTMYVGYQFAGATKPTKIQKTAFSILPRADWLNGTTVRLNGVANDSVIDIAVDIPMPFFSKKSDVPFFGDVDSKLLPGNPNGSLTVKASYNPISRGFTLSESAQSETIWIPSISLFESGNYSQFNTIRDSATADDFMALYHFEEAPLADNSEMVANRELRVRGLYTTTGGGIVGMFRWGFKIANLIEKFFKGPGIITAKPVFELDLYAKQISTINLGTAQTGTLMHLSEEAGPSPKTEPNNFPTSLGMSWIINGGGGIDVTLLGGVATLYASITHNMNMAYGDTYSGSVAARQARNWSVGRLHENWFNLELSLFFGLINIDLFRGMISHSQQDDNVMPSYYVFSGAWESVFRTGTPSKVGDAVQSLQPLAMLPEELPYYRPAPVIASNANTLRTAHVEQALLDNSGRLVLSSLNSATRSLESSTVIMQNRNGIHNPAMCLVGQDGSAAVAWMQNKLDTRNFGAQPMEALFSTEEVHAALYHAPTNSVQHFDRISDPAPFIGNVSVAAAADSSSVLFIWQTLDAQGDKAHIHARPAFRTPTGWVLGTAKEVWSRSGIRDLSISALADGTYLVACISGEAENEQGTQQESVSYWVVSATNVKPWEQMGVVEESTAGTVHSDIELLSNGTDVLLMYGRSNTQNASQDSSVNARTITIHQFSNGSWTALGAPNLGAAHGLFRHIKADVSPSGMVFALIDAYDQGVSDTLGHNIITIVGSLNTPANQWKVFSNNDVYTEGNRSIWSADASIGHDGVLYLVTQELDSTRGNRQTYRNGSTLGATRLNTVVRAMKLSDQGNLVGVRFGGTPTSVEESTFDELEASLRYRVRLMNPSPNPVSGTCTVPVFVQKSCTIHVRLVDGLGSTMATVYSGPVDAGIQGLTFDTSVMPAGTYHLVISDHIGAAGSVPLVILP